MRFLLDENVSGKLARFLQGLGHDVAVVTPQRPRASDDFEVLTRAVVEDRIVVTYDRDFGDLIFRQSLTHAGVIYMRLNSAALPRVEARLAEALAYQSDSIRQFLVITDKTIRVRRS